MKKILVLSLIILTANKTFAAPNYDFSTSQTNNQSQTINVYKPTTYVQNQIANNSKYDIVEIVIDYSGSMRPWIDRAKNVMGQILPQIPISTHVGLRVFGQKKNNLLLNSNNLFKNVAHNMGGTLGTLTNTCQATSQIVGISPINSVVLVSAMNNTYIGSSTPLTLALEQTIYNDFKNKTSLNKKKIILITDGGESCGRNPCSFIRHVARTRNDIQIDVIMINGSNNLRCLADATGGNFYDVNSEYTFNTALSSSLKTQPVNINKQTSANIPIQSQKNTSNYQFIKE